METVTKRSPSARPASGWEKVDAFRTPAWILWVVVGVIVLLVGLWPPLFSLGAAAGSGSRLEGFQVPPTSILDPVRNILLFVPIGVAWPRQGRRWRNQGLVGIKGLVVCAALLSVLIEVGQVFLPLRIISVQDVAANTAGAVLGMGLRRLTAPAFAAWARVRVPLAIGGVLAGWAALLVGLEMADSTLRGAPYWPESHHLALGNRAQGDRDWCGTIEDLEISVQGRSWRRGDFQWQALAGNGCTDAVATSAPIPPELYTLLREQGTFSLSFTATPAAIDQDGPARILTVADSTGGEGVSVMIGQAGPGLRVRLRRPFGGVDGRRPHYLIPDVFESGVPTRIELAFGAGSLVVRAGDRGLVHEYRLPREWWMVFVRQLRWGEAHVTRLLGSLLFWMGVAAPSALLLGLAGTGAKAAPMSTRAGLLVCLLLWAGALGFSDVLAGEGLTGAVSLLLALTLFYWLARLVCIRRVAHVVGPPER